MRLPNFNFENELWNRGIKFVGGCDEVGRGCFAGPVVAAVVTFSLNSNFQAINNKQIKDGITINDSKKLSKKQRALADKWIRENALAYGIGEASVAEINMAGIVSSTRMAMRRAIKATKIKIEHLLIDAFYLPYTRDLNTKKQTAIVKGDTFSVSIAAASILAKVYRDDLMNKIGNLREFSEYNWAVNKGYGTAGHREAILKHGITPQHRIRFVNTFLTNKSTHNL